jgi:hypothetical protein
MCPSQFHNSPTRRAKKMRCARPVALAYGLDSERERTRFAAFLIHIETGRQTAARDPARAAELLAAWIADDG